MLKLNADDIKKMFYERVKLVKSDSPIFYVEPGLIVTDPETGYKYTCVNVSRDSETGQETVILLSYDINGTPKKERMTVKKFQEVFTSKKKDKKSKENVHGKK